MDESYEIVKERNEKNKVFRKRLKNLYIGRYGLIGVLFLGGWGLYVFADSKRPFRSMEHSQMPILWNESGDTSVFRKREVVIE